MSVVRAGDESVAGELLITKYGLEGGAIYQLGRALARRCRRPVITIDLKPSFTVEQLVQKVGIGAGNGISRVRAVRAWRLSRAAAALLRTGRAFCSALELATRAKNYPARPARPAAHRGSDLDGGRRELGRTRRAAHAQARPGLFCAGEMIDWDAPTGGYLLQGCFSTATRAATRRIGVRSNLVNRDNPVQIQPMLVSLRIRNLALIEDLTWELGPGFNTLTGETGAGKSILIDALSLLLGERADKSLIRTGAESLLRRGGDHAGRRRRG